MMSVKREPINWRVLVEDICHLAVFMGALGFLSGRLLVLPSYPKWLAQAMAIWAWTCITHVWAHDPRPARVASAALLLTVLLDAFGGPDLAVALASVVGAVGLGWAKRLTNERLREHTASDE